MYVLLLLCHSLLLQFVFPIQFLILFRVYTTLRGPCGSGGVSEKPLEYREEEEDFLLLFLLALLDGNAGWSSSSSRSLNSLDAVLWFTSSS
mmetsp:Transcript_2582/g.2994  ORF Transcript_2582/g.2994 Transcript_2582/m.2994 type:complete len:91 (+) Transcript_2582:381-653(+)